MRFNDCMIFILRKMNRNILIADSGSTKTDWVFLHDGTESRFQTKGINPQIQQTEEIKSVCEELATHCRNIKIDEVHFYGAGCSRADNTLRLKNIMLEYINTEHICIEHDLLAAARALFGNNSGIACILGTGSNSGVYDGEHIVKNIPALGYILGDEGSGASIGKVFLKAYFYDLLPPDMRLLFNDAFGSDDTSLINKIYREKAANVFLSQIGGFVSANNENTFCHDLLVEEFKLFFERHILPYTESDKEVVAFVGSIAYINRHIIKELKEAKGLHISLFISSPIDNLVAYHVNLLPK